MANISREEEQKIKEWIARTGGGCKDYVPTVEQRIAANEAEIAANLRQLRALTHRKKQRGAG